MKFTVGIPAYKARFLKDCINSVLNQTLTDFELVIVNDASPENIDDIVNSFTDKRIRYFVNEENFGAEHVVDNWNKCLSFANGEYFVLMGDDDLMEKNYLEEFDRLIFKYPHLNVYHCRSFLINENDEKIGLTPVWAEYESMYDNIFHRLNKGRLQYISDFVYRTSFLNSNGGFYKLPLAWGRDDITSFIAMKNKGIAHVNCPVFCYRVSNITISNSGSEERKLAANKAYFSWIENVLIKDSSNVIDNIQIANIRKLLPKKVKQRAIATILPSFGRGKVKMFLYWFRRRKVSDLKNIDIIKALVKY